MNAVSRFPDWCSLSDSDRAAALKQSKARLAGVGRELNAVKQVLLSQVPSEGPLAGMPYVAKDMIATGTVAPSWGCSEPMAPALPRASVIDRMEQAGASLIGTAVMTELAYEPSVSCVVGHLIRGARMRSRAGPRPDRLFWWRPAAVCRAWLGYRRVRPNSGVLLRRHRP